MSNALVTGATGRIGSHVVDMLLEQGREVRALCLPDDQRIDALANRGVDIVEGSLTENETLLHALDDIVDVFHLGAALTTRGASHADIFDSIARGTLNIVEGIHQLGATDMRLLYVSSTSVYYSGSTCPFPGRRCDETTPVAPSTPYGAAKRAGELIVEAASRAGWCSAAIVRPADTADCREVLSPATVFGRRWFVRGALEWYESSKPGDPDRVSPAVYQQLVERKDAELFYLVDPQGRDLELQISDARSVAQSMVRTIDRAQHGAPEILNLVAGQSWKMSEFVEGIGELAGIPGDRLAKIEGDDIDHHWLFGTSKEGWVGDVWSALRSSRGTS